MVLMGIFIDSVVELLMYANLAMFNILGQYFYMRGFSPFEVGILVAMIPAASFVSNPFWFRMKEKLPRTRLIAILTIGTVVGFWSLFFVRPFLLNLVLMAFTAFFSGAVVPIGESYVMESLIRKQKKLDLPRMFGTIGYSMGSLMIGFLLKIDVVFLFAFSTLFLVLVSFLIRRLDQIALVSEGRSAASLPRTGSWNAFLWYLVLASASILLISFNGAFLPQLIGQRGYDPALTGICFAVLSFSEVPFLLFAKKILRKMGTLLLLATGVLCISLRMFLTPFTNSELALVLVQAMHGWSYIVIYYALFDYIHYELPIAYASKAQAVFWIGIQGLSFFLGSSLGGLLVEGIGLDRTYLLLSIGLFCVAAPLTVVAVVKRFKGSGLKRKAA
ncbi:MAG TPA: MFS transporter [Thermotogota bacterium]|jgi:PPP family 3-phenylpropionic acid transporter|nr:MFS transporter [Thermotogota bacterium]OQC30320.1 MAG: putative 3-phenylpropionic acid transporter [Thermotogota bacterium ADurb.Bin062]HOD91857.1 MFS transporter [Thermotogota bacterium]HOM55112.1 MFS transporter [Thermotogota bacterium]HOS23996.1 MFS transporter [Thermotogota bacterium]